MQLIVNGKRQLCTFTVNGNIGWFHLKEEINIYIDIKK